MQSRLLNIRGISWQACTTVVIVTVCISILSSCRPKGDDPPVSKGSPTSKTSDQAEGGDQQIPSEPLFASWETPRAVLMFSGDEHGYLEPCGCTEGQSGGFALRADLVRQIQEERNWPLSAFSVGGSLRPERVTYPQSKIKFRQMLQGLNLMGYQGLQLGQEELLLGPDSLFELHTGFDVENNFDVPFLGANVTFYGTKELGTPVNSRMVEVGEARIGVVGIVGATTIKQLEQTGLTTDEAVLKLNSPQEAIQAALAELEAAQPDLLVLLSHSELDESDALAKQFPQFRIVVTANSAEDPRKEPQFVGETMIVHVGRKGKNVATVGLFPDNSLKHELVELRVERFTDHPAMLALMESYQADLQQSYDQLVNDQLAIPHSSGQQFAGAESCKTCHSYAYNIWSKSKHAHAFESLEKGHEGPDGKYEHWTSRVWDPECLSCHTTGWDAQAALRYHSGFLSLDQTPHLAGQQCENCHGPAAEHVQLETAWKQAGGAPTAAVIDSRLSLRRLKSQAEQQLCVKCHDYDNSPKFHFETYWQKVNHSGRRD